MESLRTGQVSIAEISGKIHKFGHLCVLCRDQIPEGFAAFYANNPESRTAYLTLIAVASKCRGQHIGSRLLKFVEEEAFGFGMDRLRLEVRKQNEGAFRFYQKNGYRVCDETGKSYYMEKSIKKAEK